MTRAKPRTSKAFWEKHSGKYVLVRQIETGEKIAGEVKCWRLWKLHIYPSRDFIYMPKFIPAGHDQALSTSDVEFIKPLKDRKEAMHYMHPKRRLEMND